MGEQFHIVPIESHNRLVEKAFRSRGYDEDESADIARLCCEAARHGIRTHNGIKALHLDHLFGSAVGGCVPGAEIEELPSVFSSTRIWNANHKLGPSVAYRAMDTCVRLADQHGVGMVSVDNAWHYLWGGGFVLEAARRGFIGYTNCTATLAEVVPFGGKKPALGTNPHSWAFPTQDIVGFPVLIDWATSAVAMGRVQQLKREGKSLPPGAAVDGDGIPTDDPSQVAALLPFGAHKGYGLGLINELMAGFIGGGQPTIRGRSWGDGQKHSNCFHFMAIHPDAISSGGYDQGRTRDENIKAILDDIVGGENNGAILPGYFEHQQSLKCDKAGGLLFSTAEVEAFNEIAGECGDSTWNATLFALSQK